MESSASTKSMRSGRPVHLVVLQHGLWGNTTCVSNLEKYLRQHLGPKGSDSTTAAHSTPGLKPQGPPTAAAADAGKTEPEPFEGDDDRPEVQILNSDVNRKALTYDGIDVCGARVVKMVLEAIQLLQQHGRQVTHISFIGYSLGGLILRYAVGKLYVLGLFDEVCCANFITIATPHLGSWRAPTTFWARFFNSNVAIVASRTGRQLMLLDSDYSVPWLTQQQQRHTQAHTHQHEQTHHQQQQQQQQQEAELFPPGVEAGQAVPLLLLMAHPAGPFHRALAGFRTRLLAANIKYDAMVPYCTAALCVTNPYDNALPVPVDPQRYPSVVRPAAAGEAVAELTYSGRTKRLVLFALFSPLAPLLYIWTVTYGWLHHRSARRKTLEGTWLQQQQQQQQQPKAGKSGSSSSSSVKGLSKPLLPHNPRTAATLTTTTATAAAAGGVKDEETPEAAAEGELISTAVEETCIQQQQQQQQQQQGVEEGVERTPLEQAMQQAVASTAEAPAASILDPNSPSQPEGIRGMWTASSGPQGAAEPPPAAAAEVSDAVADAAAAAPSRRRSSSLAAAVQHYQEEDELGHLTRQISSSKGNSSSNSSKQTPGTGPSKPAAAAAATAPDRTTAAAAAAAAADAQVKASRVTVDSDGIVEAPSSIHQQQQWMAQQLFDNMPPCIVPENSSSSSSSSTTSTATADPSPAGATTTSSSSNPKLRVKEGWPQQQQQQQQGVVLSGGGWQRVDVYTRHWHAHAAIIIRDYRFKGQSRDVFQYIVDHMSL